MPRTPQELRTKARWNGLVGATQHPVSAFYSSSVLGRELVWTERGRVLSHCVRQRPLCVMKPKPWPPPDGCGVSRGEGLQGDGLPAPITLGIQHALPPPGHIWIPAGSSRAEGRQ